MNSPFPGMDPYLEQFWGDVHHGLATYARDQLQSRLPSGLRARINERVLVEAEDGDRRTFLPDVRVAQHDRSTYPQTETTSVVTAEPLVVPAPDAPDRQAYVEIVEAKSGGRLITVVEFLSPTNKIPGEGRELYERKRRECRDGGVNLVEIDLTRSGQRGLSVPASHIPQAYRTTYQVCVRRGWRPSTAEVYRAGLREPLPNIRVPLRETDADAPLVLQDLVDLCYRNGRYDDLDYRAEPNPPLDADDAAWADALLRAAGKR